MLVFNGLRPFAEFCEKQALSQAAVLYETAGVCGETMQKTIKAVYGDHSKLKALQQSTIDIRGGSDDPLLVDGTKLRDSIEERHESLGPESAVTEVGSAESLVLSHEHGYITAPESMIPGKWVPPRPAFAIGVAESIPKVQAIVRLLMGPNRRPWRLARAENLEAATGLVAATR